MSRQLFIIAVQVTATAVNGGGWYFANSQFSLACCGFCAGLTFATVLIVAKEGLA